MQEGKEEEQRGSWDGLEVRVHDFVKKSPLRDAQHHARIDGLARFRRPPFEVAGRVESQVAAMTGWPSYTN